MAGSNAPRDWEAIRASQQALEDAQIASLNRLLELHFESFPPTSGPVGDATARNVLTELARRRIVAAQHADDAVVITVSDGTSRRVPGDYFEYRHFYDRSEWPPPPGVWPPPRELRPSSAGSE